MDIQSPSDFGKVLKNGAFAWPGGYPLFFICDDGAPLSFEYAQANAKLICQAIRDKDRGGWRVVASDINWEDADLYCEGGAKIESAYN